MSNIAAEEGEPVDPNMSDNPTGRFITDDSSSLEDEEEDKETELQTQQEEEEEDKETEPQTQQEEEEEDSEGEDDFHGNSSSSESEKFVDASQQLEDSGSSLQLKFSDPTSCSKSDDSGSPSSPEAVWNPPSFTTPDQSRKSGPQEESSPTFPSQAPVTRQTTPLHKEEPTARTVYQNWDVDDNAQGDKTCEASSPGKQERVLPRGTVYQNWAPEMTSAPPPVPERTFRGDAPPIPPKSYRNVTPTRDSTFCGSDEYHSMHSLPGNTNQSRAAIPPNPNFPTMSQNNTGTEGQAPALPAKPPIAEWDPHNNPQSIPPKMEYPHFQNPSYPYSSMPGGMPSLGNPYNVPGQPFPFSGSDAGMWGVPADYQQNLSMQQYMQMQYYYMMQYEQGMKSQMTAPQTLSGPTPRGDTDSAVPSQGQSQGQKKQNPKEEGHTTAAPQLKGSSKTEQTPPKVDLKKPKKEPTPKARKIPQGKDKVVPKSVPREEEKTSANFLCVNGLNPDTTEETLSNFLEAKVKNDVEVKSVVYSEERETAVVQFDSPVDVDELNKACKKKPLEGNYIINEPIDHSRLIVVSAEGEVTEEILKKYFQNSALSSGGDVQRVTHRNDGCFTVKFKHEEDTLRVCKKLDHKVSHTPLVVTPLFFTDHGEIYDAMKHRVPLPDAFIVTDVDSHLQRFLQQSNQTVEQINSELEKKFAKAIVTEEIQVECLLSQKTPNARQHVKTWKTDAKESFDYHVREIIQKAEIEVTEDAWSEVEEYITITHMHSSDSIITIYEKDTLKIVFVGMKTLVQDVHIQTSNQNKAIESKLERKRQIISEERECSVSNIRLLERLGVFAEVNDIREDLDVDKDCQNGKILFRGVRDDVLEARLRIEEKLNQFEKWTITEGLSKYQILLLGTEGRKSDLQDAFQRQGLTVEVEFEGEAIKVYVVDNSQKSSAHNIIMNLTKESSIVLDETSLNVLSTEKWELEMMTILSENYERVMISPSNDAKITITTTSDLHIGVKTRLENFIQEHSIYTDIVDIDDEGVVKFIVKHCSKLLEKIQDKHQQHFLKVEVQNKQVMMSGTKEGISLARSDVMAMTRDINHEIKTYNQPGINKVLRTDQERLVEIEDNCRSIIMFTGPSPRSTMDEDTPRRLRREHTVLEPRFRTLPEEETLLSFAESPRPVPAPRVQSGPYRCAESNIVIKLIKGDLAKQEGDVIVCSVGQDLHLNKGQASRNLLKEGGQGLMADIETNYPNGVQLGELANIGGGNLRCQELYLGYLPNWSDTKGKTPNELDGWQVLVEFMNKCLKTAENSSYQTIIFPAMGTGQLGYPKDKVAEMMYQTVIDFDRKCAGTQVKEIKFICYPGDLETCDAFEAEEKHRLNPHLPKAIVKAPPKGPYITKNKIKVSIVKAEIGKHSADVLVVACEKTLNLSDSGKAAKSLLENGGALLQEGARVKYPNGIANFGNFASIPGAGLQCQEVYLTAIPKEEQATQTTLCKFIGECMKQADQSGYGSIAFAAIGTGSMKYSASDVAKNMYNEVKTYSDSNPNCNVKLVQFVLYPADTKSIKAFEDREKKLLHRIRYSSGSGAYTTSNHGVVVTVKTASITKLKDTVIVLTAYPDLNLNKTQVTKAVLKEGGGMIQMDICNNYPNGIKEGDVAIVGSGNLPCKEIYIGTLPKYSSDPNTADKTLKDFVMKCLTVATQKGHTSVSLPCLGTGYNGYPHAQAAAVLFEAVTEYDKKASSTSVKGVNFVALNSDHKSLRAFQSEEKKFCSQQAQSSLGQSVSFLPSLSSSFAMEASSLVRGMVTRASRMFKSEVDEEEDISDVVARPGQKQNEVMIGQLTVSVSAGDLTEQKVDAIVNSTNLDLDFTQGGVSAALVKKCGKQLLTECSAKKDEMKKEKMVVTSGCGLSNIKHIIHIECQSSISNWRSMVKKTLEMANSTQCTTIAFPVVGTGKGFVSFTTTAIGEMFLESVSEFMSQNRQCKMTLVKIVAFQEDMVTPLSKALRDACGKSRATGMRSKLSDMASSVGLFPQRGLASSADKEDPSVTLWIYGDTQGDRDNTKKEIQTFIKSQSTRAEIKDQLLPTLKPNEKKKIECVKEQHDVKMSLELQKGLMTVEGLFDEVANAKDKIHNLLRGFQKERWLDEEAKLVADTVQWSVMVKDQQTGLDKLEEYPERQNMYLETAYKKKENQVKLRTEDGDIIVDLTTMKEYPADDPSHKDNVVRKEKVTGNMIELPAHWTPMQDTENIKVITLLPSSTEYTDIEKKFINSVKTGIYNIGKAPNPANNPVGQFNNVKITKIERIQNPSLYQQYAAKRAHIEKHVDQNTTLEQDLWHGAPPTAIVSINYYGFNRSYCGDNAGEPWFGRGVYFANDASYSARDWVSAPDSSRKKKMYQAKVITGHFCKGQKGMRYLPERMTGVNYDCAVNDANNPLEFVIFNDTQAYPEYCIEFTI
ncbi:protein mono-ADP-ribosyltransferase PARP14-like isoform X3 [Ostrea edulis]|uniref:protein mono-ADP-ribosyltransferase PARP14-like isoform X3 n=1 Tax=Ostrea edulis TaxID=37623 RepID=UPI0024AF5F96|nr:protein mono-ADP-ribosyltransferase PARP14-like isoform X3 [Ostrea edulis]